ncbi:MAG: DUF3999 domain-containing protein [Gammaproteobacteria bacterium]|nr:DUF3999 domain-containing protein [Gammaproteobacteria bacterium]
MMQRFVLVFMLFFAANARAIDKNEFAYGYNLEVDGDGAIYSLTLPEDVYRGMTRPDHGDLRVFNSRGEAVPQLLRREQKKITTAHSDIVLPIFPLYASEQTQSPGRNLNKLHITTDEQGAVIDINYGKTTANARKLSGYLLDVSGLETVPNALLLQWPDQQPDFVVGVQVEASEDLDHWQTLISSASLSNLHYANNQLIQQRIELPLHKHKYLRLTWDKPDALTLSQVMAQFPESVQAQPRQWIQITSTPVIVSDSKEQVFGFDTQGYFPVDRVNLVLAQHNTVLRAKLESSANANGPWQEQYTGIFYDLQYEGKLLQTPELSIASSVHRYWRLRVAPGETKFNGMPMLKLGWIPEQLLFTAQGEAPFLLAFGGIKIAPTNSVLGQLINVDSIANTGQMIKPARLAARITLGDSSVLEPPQPPLPWKKWILWAVLVIGVLVLALMAYRLTAQMNQNKPSA